MHVLCCAVLQDQDGKAKKVSIQDNGDGTYRVSYVPDKVGRYTIVIKYGGDEIPTSPYRVRATSTGDASKCTVTGGWRPASVSDVSGDALQPCSV